MSLPENARELVRFHAKKHVEDTPANETEQEWAARAERMRVRVSLALRAAVRQEDMYELLVDYEEMQSLESGTHPDLNRNQQQTVDNTLDLTEEITKAINDSITAVLANAEPMSGLMAHLLTKTAHTERISA